MSKFYSVKPGNKLKFKGCTCGYGLRLGDIVECVGVVLDKFYWVNPYTGDKRITKMGSSCFELVKEDITTTKESNTVKNTDENEQEVLEDVVVVEKVEEESTKDVSPQEENE